MGKKSLYFASSNYGRASHPHEHVWALGVAYGLLPGGSPNRGLQQWYIIETCSFVITEKNLVFKNS